MWENNTMWGMGAREDWKYLNVVNLTTIIVNFGDNILKIPNVTYQIDNF